MTLTNNQLAKAKKTYEIYWESYIKGDLETFASTLDENFEMIGTSESEVAHNKAEGIEFYKAQMEEIIGKAEMRNRQISIKPLGAMVLINETCDIYVLGEPDLHSNRQDGTFYSKIRISTLLHETGSGWKVIQQHGSLPDMRVEEGETMAIEKITKENLELRDAVKRRTAELEHKNRELAIEAALERVRAVAMGMKEPEEMLDVCRIISDQLQQFGIDNIRNVQIAIIDQNIGQYLCYQYFTAYNQTAVEKTEYLKSPVEHGMVKQMLTSKDGHFTGTLEGKELKEFREHRKAENHLPDPFLDKATKLDYCFLSIGEGGLGLTLYQPMAEEVLKLFKRFHQVFYLAYQRFRDIQKAEAQAREAQIEVAVERVRAQSMAMHHPDDLDKVNKEILAQLNWLQIQGLSGVTFYLVDQDGWVKAWDFSSPGNIGNQNSYTLQFDFKRYEMMGYPFEILQQTDLNYFIADYPFEKLEKAASEIEEINPEVANAFKEALAKGILTHQWSACARITDGLLGVDLVSPPSEDTKTIVLKIAGAFNQAYQRFLDLQKAEALAREAQIEAALERVRAQTMAMHSSEDVGKCVVKMFSELTALGVDEGTRFGIGILNHENENNQLWTARKTGEEVNMHIGTIDMAWHPMLKRARQAWLEQVPFHQYVLEGEDLLNYYRMLNNAPDYKIQIPIEKLPKKEIQHCFIFEHGFFYAFSPNEFQPQLIHITKRFSALFEQTYRRYLDLVKAESQAREAEIELALERVRARTMAMHHSEELSDAGNLLFQQLKLLGIQPETSWLWFVDTDTDLVEIWTTHENKLAKPIRIDPEKLPTVQKEVEAWKNKVPTLKLKIQESEAVKAIKEFFGIEISHPEDAEHFHLLQIRHNYGFLGLGTWNEATEIEIKLYSRFAKVFEQTYTRFLDLQKAEAQAREAQIEAALEKVRSRSLAMHKSSELNEVVSVLFERLKDLQIPFTAVGIATNIEGSKDLNAFVCGQNEAGLVITNYRLPYFDNPVPKDLYSAIEKQLDYFVGHYSKEEKDAFYNYVIANTAEFRHLPEDIKRMIFDSTNYTISMVAVKNAVFNVNDFEGKVLAKNEIDIIQRFARVFDQAYTRFLDLQKAEAQAREAQIEAALERVRSRTMAMQSSDELSEAATEMFSQIKGLGLNPWSCGFNIFNEDKTVISQWVSSGDGRPIKPFDTPTTKDVFKKIVEHSEQDELLYIQKMEGKKLENTYKYMASLPTLDNIFAELDSAGIALPKSQVDHVAYFKHGYLMFITYEETPEFHSIFKRFAKVFEQTYTRFLDLKKAEAQAREAKIETALEKVRSRSMGMQSSEELPEVANLMFLEIQALGIHAWSCGYCILEEDRRSSTCIMSSEGTIQKPFLLPHFGEPSFEEWDDFVQSKESFFVQELKGRAIESHYDFMTSLPQLKATFQALKDAGLSLPTYQINHLCKFTHGFLLFITYESVLEAHEIFKRFTNVFDQTYTRFLDLQKAEAQAQEARIEAALERVRSRTMGMQKAEELGDVATVLFSELNSLVDNLWTCGFVLCEQNRQEDEWWLSLDNGLIQPFSLPNVGDYAHESLYQGWQQGEAYRTVTLENEKLSEHYDWLMEIPIAKKIFEEMESSGIPRPNWQRLHAAYFKTGYLVIITEVPCEEEEIFKRFAQVFDLTYTRFLDLQKAEKQAREAQIEAALERIRSRAVAMQTSDELKDVAMEIRTQMGLLGQRDLEVCAIHLYEEHENDFESWGALQIEGRENLVLSQSLFPKSGKLIIDEMMDRYGSDQDEYVLLNAGKKAEEWFDLLKQNAPETYSYIIKSIGNLPVAEMRAYWAIADFSGGSLVMVSYSFPDADSRSLLRRTANVFGLAYKRFKDLRVAEISTKAAMRQASLDRVRADISSMRHADDLDRITPLIFKELTVLGVPFIRCGVFIINEKQKLVEAYLSSPEGNSLGVLRLPYRASELTFQTVEAWRRGKVLRQHWNKEDFIQWINQLMDQDQIQDSSTYQGTAAPPESLDLHFVPFDQGMLYVGAVNPLEENELELVQALAKAFSIAYARYEDFVKLERAKSEVESAMSELKATQSQLVQQEKLASLGQLTAGIAHEIKNPLNFVNNFSELSGELIDEAFAELEKLENSEEKEEIIAILQDVKGNLSKVHEHGTRANGIVTSMLQHSRGGDGKMEPTDLNALLKEYVNLSFHGMRAGKNPIEVDIILELDPEIKEVSLIKEDFTRVIINLCNNAFDACAERSRSAMRGKVQSKDLPGFENLAGLKDYLPKLTVRTKSEKDSILIEIEDNGPGIPDEIKDKILQPFFTTKKGTEGTGLGLSITNDIVKAHGGEIAIETSIDSGAKFIIKLPQ
ncbi:ATP-binding protein [Algoriphagus hitonicola]|uniref:histidine kinase n=1 Tax=Algoriphagus hitonicola TaxID=435880 RepID=A0A1I2Q0X7_9BACT|nr:ATP-binding protein [Algoriphagus hitonicola]SFG21323.1 His Kinase A (phospho-acceptor) domain-containing protein [Algoriphagus hitonicola]